MRVLVVEDEVLLALDLTEMLRSLGHDVVASAATLEDGLKRIDDSSFDVAIVDVNLNGSTSEPIAERLSENGVRCILATGYASANLPFALAGYPLLDKPYNIDELERTLSAIGSKMKS